MCKEQLNTCFENEKALRQKACKALFACIFCIKFHEFYILSCSLSQHIFPQTEISIIQDAVYGSCATIFPYCISPRTFLLSNFLSVCDFDFCCKSCIFKLQAANFCDICKKDTWLLDFGAGFWNVKYNSVAKTYLEISRYLNFTQTELILHVIHFSWKRIKEDWIGGAAFAYMLFNYVLAIWRRRPSVLPLPSITNAYASMLDDSLHPYIANSDHWQDARKRRSMPYREETRSLHIITVLFQVHIQKGKIDTIFKLFSGILVK